MSWWHTGIFLMGNWQLENTSSCSEFKYICVTFAYLLFYLIRNNSLWRYILKITVCHTGFVFNLVHCVHMSFNYRFTKIWRCWCYVCVTLFRPILPIFAEKTEEKALFWSEVWAGNFILNIQLIWCWNN